jgi:putative peptidoglycan lipid II flippase
MMLFRAGVLSLVLLVVSRLLGLAREAAQAAAFGISGLGDVVVLMLTLPDWLTSVTVGGALGYVLLPFWASRVEKQDRAGAGCEIKVTRNDAPSSKTVATSQRRIAQLLLAGGVASGFAIACGSPILVTLLAPGVPASLVMQATLGLFWSAAALPLAALAALWGTRLQHESDFTGFYSANFIVNAVLVIALVAIARSTTSSSAVHLLGVALVGAMALRLTWQAFRIHQISLPNISSSDSMLVDARLPSGAIWLWAVLSAGLPLALPFVARSLASSSGEGALVTFNYAWKLVELPLGLAVQLVASLAFPSLARIFASGEDPTAAMRHAFALAWILACATAAALLVAAPTFAQLLFGWGRMTHQDTARIAQWGAIGAWSLLPQALIAVGLVVLAALRRMHVAVIAYALALALLIVVGSWQNDGMLLMMLLNAGSLLVALIVIWEIRRALRNQINWLPWREMLASFLIVAFAGGISCLFTQKPLSLNSAALGYGSALGIGEALAMGFAVLAAAWFSGPSLRQALRQQSQTPNA